MPCKIKKTTETRVITEDEFVLQKESEPYASMRQAAKSLNFLNIFGGSPKIFAERALETRWSEAQCDAYISSNDLDNLLDKTAEKYKRESPLKIKYITVATHLQQLFFEGYAGLKARLAANKEFAQKAGYVRCRFGAARKLMEEMLRGSYDEKANSALMRNLDNICANTDIQNFEASIIHQAMSDVEDWLHEHHYKSTPFNCVHDSMDIYVHKDELKVVSSKIIECFERALPELNGIPLKIDFSVSDLTKGEYYKGGSKLQTYLEE
jgi:DNA polymerase I-like protein with 3'-5' exonuclease and polymerase domains